MNKLNEFLSKMESNEMVYLGTIKGSGWLIIDTAENLLGKLDELNTQLIKAAECTVQRSQKVLNELPSFIVATQNEIAECSDEKEVKKLKKKLANYETKYATAYNNRLMYGKALNKWTPVKNRLVHKTEVHESEIVGTCVLISGFENGKYWFYEEQFKTKK